MSKNVIFYRDKPITDLTREELIEAIEGLMHHVETMTAMHERDRSMRKEFADARNRMQ